MSNIDKSGPDAAYAGNISQQEKDSQQPTAKMNEKSSLGSVSGDEDQPTSKSNSSPSDSFARKHLNAKGIPSPHILLFSRGLFQGSNICNALIGGTVFRSTSGEPETKESTIGNNSVVITNMPLKVGQQNENEIVQKARRYIEKKSYTAVVIVLSLPQRATPDGESYYRIIRNIIGTGLHQNTILAFTNATSLYDSKNKSWFRKYLCGEILTSKKRRSPEDALGTLIKTVHSNQEHNWETFHYNQCVLFDEEEKSTHMDLMNKVEKCGYNVMHVATNIKSGSAVKSSFMFALIVILVGMVIKLSWDNYSRAVSSWEEKISTLENECNNKISKIESELKSVENEMNKWHQQCNTLETKIDLCESNNVELGQQLEKKDDKLKMQEEKNKVNLENLKKYYIDKMKNFTEDMENTPTEQ